MFDCVANLASPVMLDLGVMDIDPTGKAELAETFADIRSVQEVRARTQPVRYAALLHSRKTHELFTSRFDEAFEGMYRLMVEHHIPLEIVNEAGVRRGELEQYQVLVIPDAVSLGDETVDGIREAVNRGLGVVATHMTGLMDGQENPLSNIAKAQTLAGRPSTDRYAAFASVRDMLATQARTRGDALYIIYRDDDTDLRETRTYAEFFAQVNRLADYLSSELGVGRGDRVGTVCYNHPETVELYFAVWSLGAVVVPVNVAEEDERHVFTFNNAEVRVVCVRPDTRDRVLAFRDQLDHVEHVLEVGGPGAGDVPGTATVLEGRDPAFEPADPPTAEDEALVVYTSGTTGNPKGVVLVQYNLLINPDGIAKWHGLTADSRLMCILPIHHVNGTIVTLLTPMYVGGSVVLCRKPFMHSFWDTVAEEGVHIVSLVPTILQFLWEANRDVSNLDLSAFRYVVSGAGTLSIGVAKRWEERFGFPVVHGYGLSETTCYNCFLPPDLDAETHRAWMQDYGYPSIGVPISCNEMTIHDEQGAELPPGERGEICIRGHDVMKYYYNRPDANADAFAHGWFRSGDEGFHEVGADGQHYFFITGRLKELIIRGGVNISPFEVEEIMGEVPGVNVALAIAFDNDYYGDEVGGYVVKEEGATVTAEDVLAACREHLPFHKQPKVIVFGEEIPVTSTGKYQRLKLKHLFAEWEHVQYRKPNA